VTMSVERNRLPEYFDEESSIIPAALNSLITRPSARPRLVTAPPSLEERSVAAAVIECRRTGPLRRLFIEAKAMELFCLVLDRFSTESDGKLRTARISQRDRRQLSEAREFLAREFTSPPTIHNLARQFGLNRNKLCSGFQLLFGVSIYEFCSALRLDTARKLLRSGLTMTEVALSSGYGSSSAFSAAFHRRFGLPPSKCRCGAATVDPADDNLGE
jgi:AraC family transcriptional activator of pyochelin receptor